MPAIFPRWTNAIPVVIGLIAPIIGAGAIFFVWYYFSPLYTDVGYQPKQPVPYSHKLHAGEMGLDCRYCHNTVEYAAKAAIPPTQTCMNCHDGLVRTTNPGGPFEGRIAGLKESWDSGKNGEPSEAVEWIRVHMLPDYAYFNHAPHVAAGVGCASCHGRVDQMVIVAQEKPMSMGWCLDCHRNPKPHLRPLDEVTNMGWDLDAETYDPDRDPERKRKVDPPKNCSGCHR